MAIFGVGYYPAGYFPTGYFGAATLPLGEQESVSRWLGDRITAALAAAGLSSIPVWDSEIPEPNADDSVGTNSRFPAVSIRLHSGSDRLGAGGFRVMSWSQYQVVVLDTALSFAPSSPTVQVIDAALRSAHGLTRDGAYYIGGAIRQTTIRYIERSPATGNRYNHQGGIYRIQHYAIPAA
jgi:hypothetical protein